jgi:sortase A
LLRFAESFLLFVGIAGIAVWGWSRLREKLAQHQDSKEFDYSTLTPGKQPPRAVPDNAVIGRILIPRLRFRAMVRQGTSARTLDVAVGHIPGTAFPGDTGNVAMAAHRDTLFRALRDIQNDDLIEFETERGSYRYTVEGTQIVKPENVGVLKAGSSNELTLVTCYPFDYIGSAPERFIVKARQIYQDKPTPVESAQVEKPAARVPPRIKPLSLQPLPYKMPQVSSHRFPFEVPKGHSRQLAAGVSVGITDSDANGYHLKGWVWIMPERKTLWLHDAGAVSFRSPDGGRILELVITAFTDRSARGYLVVSSPADN